jgi:hypothetical protein
LNFIYLKIWFKKTLVLKKFYQTYFIFVA